MTIYHGGTIAIEKPKILKPSRFLDFGHGFYTTSSLEQAMRWAKIKSQRELLPDAFVSVYELDINILNSGGYKQKIFDEPNQEWLDFVLANRRGLIQHDFDFVKGPVANDTLFQVFTLYEAGILTLSETIVRLKTNLLFDQILFHTEKSLSELVFVESLKE